MVSKGHFDTLDADECQRLLRSGVVGRVGWQSSDGPMVLPVNYAFEGGEIVFRTREDGRLAELAEQTPVAFEVDDFDADAENGWSVLVRGTAAHQGAEESNPLPSPWAPGPRNLVIAITATEFSGRAVSSPR